MKVEIVGPGKKPVKAIKFKIPNEFYAIACEGNYGWYINCNSDFLAEWKEKHVNPLTFEDVVPIFQLYSDASAYKKIIDKFTKERFPGVVVRSRVVKISI